jgi:hypothetical protein
MTALSDWRVAGTYFESCNCDAVCPCRMVDGVRGGRSTHGECIGALSWAIEAGHADGLDLDGLAVAMVVRYHDDEPGSPWRIVLHVDERATREQHDALAAIFLGEAGGEHMAGLPWVRKACESVAVRSSPVEIGHADGVHQIHVGPSARVRASRPVEGDADISCVISGYERIGTELYADEFAVQGDGFEEELRGNCAFVTSFDYDG